MSLLFASFWFVLSCVFVVLGVGCRIPLLCFYALSFDVILSFIHRSLSFAFPIRIGASLPVVDSLNLKPPRVYLYPVRSVRFRSYR